MWAALEKCAHLSPFKDTQTHTHRHTHTHVHHSGVMFLNVSIYQARGPDIRVHRGMCGGLSALYDQSVLISALHDSNCITIFWHQTPGRAPPPPKQTPQDDSQHFFWCGIFLHTPPRGYVYAAWTVCRFISLFLKFAVWNLCNDGRHVSTSSHHPEMRPTCGDRSSALWLRCGAGVLRWRCRLGLSCQSGCFTLFS